MRHLRNILNTRSKTPITVGTIVHKDKSSYTVETASGKRIKVVGSKDFENRAKVTVSGNTIVGLADTQKNVKEVLI